MSTYALDDDKVVVEGILRDERFRPIYELSGQRREKGVVHHMIIRLLIGGSRCGSRRGSGDAAYPMPLCVTTARGQENHRIQDQERIRRKVHKLIGGVEGCAHLTHLLTVMVQEALHGYWTHKMRKPEPPPALGGD